MLLHIQLEFPPPQNSGRKKKGNFKVKGIVRLGICSPIWKMVAVYFGP